MRIVLIIAWLFVGLAGVIFHFGPGQDHTKLDRLDSILQSAQRCVDNEEWASAIEMYDLALGEVPSERAREARAISLAKAKAQMMDAQLPEARESLEDLLTESRADEESSPRFVAEVESALASAQYYNTWLMRLEGLAKEAWLPEIESARQHYTQIMLDAEAMGDSEMAQQSREDLEAAIRLSRMDLAELQGLPLPCQCKGCCSCKGKNKVKKYQKGPPAKGAGLVEIPEGSGS